MLFCIQESTFIRRDVELLGRTYEASLIQVADFGSIHSPLAILRFFFASCWAVFRHKRQLRALIFWFLDYHVLFPAWLGSLFGIPRFVILGGFDACKIPSIGYGLFSSRWRRPLASLSAHFITEFWPVCQQLIQAKYSSFYFDDQVVGLRSLLKTKHIPFSVISTAYETECYVEKAQQDDSERDIDFAMIATSQTKARALVKGVDLLIQLAQQLPKQNFYLVGATHSFLEAFCEDLNLAPHLPKNVIAVEALSEPELRTFLKRVNGLLSLSRSEGLSNVLCEGLLSGSRIVCSDVGGFASLFPDHCLVLSSPKIEEIAKIMLSVKAKFADAPAKRLAPETIHYLGFERRRQQIVDRINTYPLL